MSFYIHMTTLSECRMELAGEGVRVTKCRNCELEAQASWTFCPQCGHRIAGVVISDTNARLDEIFSSLGQTTADRSTLHLNATSPGARIAEVRDILQKLLHEGQGDADALKRAIEHLSQVHQATEELSQTIQHQRRESVLQSDLERELRRTTRRVE